MKLCEVINYNKLKEYVKQNSHLELYLSPSPLPPNLSPKKIEILIHYDTPIAYILDGEIYCPLYINQNFLTKTTAIISSQLSKFSNVIPMDSFIHYIYEYLEYPIVAMNRRFYNEYVDSLVGD